MVDTVCRIQRRLNPHLSETAESKEIFLFRCLLTLRWDLLQPLCAQDNSYIKLYYTSTSLPVAQQLYHQYACNTDLKPSAPESNWQLQYLATSSVLHHPQRTIAMLKGLRNWPLTTAMASDVLYAWNTDIDDELAWTTLLDEVDYWCQNGLGEACQSLASLQRLRETVKAAIANCYDF
jgi:hypothetical protein